MVNLGTQTKHWISGTRTFEVTHGILGRTFFAVRHLDKEALSNQARSGPIEEDAWGTRLKITAR